MAVTISGSSPTFSSGYQGGTIISGTAQASTSGTSIDFTSIPSWVKRITVMYSGLSQSGGSSSLIQLGTSGGIITSGYWSYCDNGPSIYSSAGFVVGEDSSGFADSGTYTICLLSSTIWAGGGNFVRDNNGVIKSCAGRLTGAGTIDRVRITTVNGTDTFDAGTVNILYE